MTNNNGRWAVVLYNDRQMVGTVVDCVAGTGTPKRIRIQRGAIQGTVLMPAQYEFKRWLNETDVDD